jgi:AcrR family transcriptional regulator
VVLHGGGAGPDARLTIVRVGALPPRSARSARRDEIVRVASSVLRQRGVSASLQDIADQLGITYNALYHHFKSRDDLLLQCLVRSGGLLYDSLVASDQQGGSGLDKVLRFLRDFVAVSVREETPSGYLSAALSQEAQSALYELSLPSRALLQRFIDDGIADGSVADCDALVAAAWILHTLYWWPHELEVDRHRKLSDVADGIIALTERALASAAR